MLRDLIHERYGILVVQVFLVEIENQGRSKRRFFGTAHNGGLDQTWTKSVALAILRGDHSELKIKKRVGKPVERNRSAGTSHRNFDYIHESAPMLPKKSNLDGVPPIPLKMRKNGDL
jgi:hypothetical protein